MRDIRQEKRDKNEGCEEKIGRKYRDNIIYLSSFLSPSLASTSPPVAEDGFPLSSSTFSLQDTSDKQN